MDTSHSSEVVHPKGEAIFPDKCNNGDNKDEITKTSNRIQCDTYKGIVHIEWDPQVPVTPLGQLPFFIEFLKVSSLYNEWVLDCPLQNKLTGPNSSSVHNILGTFFLSSLSGQRRYAHITSIRNDSVNPPLLGMSKIVSEDTARRAFAFNDGSVEKYSEEWYKSRNKWRQECKEWQSKHLLKCYKDLTCEPWILDIDATVKPLYGNQEGAEIGYNPTKPGRPSHVIHTYIMAGIRIILDAEVTSGNQSAAKYTLPRLWEIIDELPYNNKPTLLRGDCAYGNELVLSGAEKRGLNYLFKVKKTKGVKALIDFVGNETDDKWKDAGQGWSGIGGNLKLDGWTKRRNVVILRRILKRSRGRPKQSDQLLLPFICANSTKEMYEYSMLISNLELSVFSIAQLYRDRADSENVNDELKNQWGWGGFVTQDILRTQITARIIAQCYNWWSFFTRLADPDKHREAITSRPFMLYGVGRKTSHAGQTIITVTPTHGRYKKAGKVMASINSILSWFRSNAEQLITFGTWKLILSLIFKSYLNGRVLGDIKNVPQSFFLLEYG